MKDNMKNNLKIGTFLQSISRSALALTCSLVLAGIIIKLCGFSPTLIYLAVFRDSFSSLANIALCISQATPLIFTGLAFTMGLKVGLINTGGEGQLIAGAMCGALAGAYITFLPGTLHLGTCILIGAVAGGLVALLTTYLKVKFNSSEIIIGIMLNNIIILVTSYLATGPLKPKGTSIAQTKEVLSSAKLPRLIPRTQTTSAIIIAVLAAVGFYIILSKTVLGYKIRVVGTNRLAGTVAGINSSKVYYLSSFMFGSINGIAGACIALGIFYRFVDGISVGYGFEGIPVAALAGYNPLGVLFSGFLFGILRAGTMTLSRTSSVPLEIVSVIQALVVVFVSAPTIITSIKDLKIFRRFHKKSQNSNIPVKGA
ncbi:MAG: ABC transporter permease [Acetivibrionales bacterium]|jgi:ABC-type uncharacterized transport system permease subunit